MPLMLTKFIKILEINSNLAKFGYSLSLTNALEEKEINHNNQERKIESFMFHVVYLI